MTEKIKALVHELAPGAVIELFELDLSRFGQPPILFHAGTNEVGSDIVWQGKTYNAYPIKGSGFEMKGQGTLPRPKLMVSNITGIISALCKQFEDLVWCKVIRRKTMARYLDTVNFPEGNPTADPGEAYPDDIFYINQKTGETKEAVEFEMAVIWDVEGVLLPRRQVIQNMCPWKYKGEGCGYADLIMADANDNYVADPSKDSCGKLLNSCAIRHPNQSLPFGGFPGVGQTR